MQQQLNRLNLIVNEKKEMIDKLKDENEYLLLKEERMHKIIDKKTKYIRSMEPQDK